MLIFDEVKFAKNLLQNGYTKFVSLKELSILAKYLREEEGLGFKKIEDSLVEFCSRYNPNFNAVKNAKFIQRAVNSAKNYLLRRPEAVIITQAEMARIREIKNFQYEKILFVMLVIGKFFKFGTKRKVNQKASLMGYFSNVKLSDITLLAKVRLNKPQRNEMLHYLYTEGYIDTTYTGGLRLCYADDKSPVEIIITEYDDIVSYYKPVCEECGKVIERSFRRKYICEDCVLEQQRNAVKERVKRSRDKRKQKLHM